MAVKLEGTISRYIGLSTDDKPGKGKVGEGLEIIEQEIRAGSSFLETDTGRIWRYDGQDWQFHIPEDAQLHLLELIYGQLHTINERLELL